jgi:hypothetical protein
MKNIFITLSLSLSFFLSSCNGSIDQDKISGQDPDKVGKYFYGLFKNNKKEEFNKWMYNPNYTDDFWNVTQNFRGNPFSWNTSEYEKCVITQKNQWDEYFINIYFKNKEDNHSYFLYFLLFKVEEKNDGKYYLSTSYSPNIRPNKN